MRTSPASLLSVASITLAAACASPLVGSGAAAPAAAAARSEVTLTYLGVAGWQISDGTHVILVDPYFTRPAPDLADDAPLVPDTAAIAAHSPPRADLILVGHSHFDHALDVAEVAKRTGAQVLGTVSTAHLAHAGGVADDHIIPVKGGEDYQFDGFSVRVIPSLHSAIGGKHIFGGTSEIPADVKLPMPTSGYAEGGTLAYLVRLGGHQILIVGTASYIEREVDGLRPDIAIVALGLRDQITDYTCRLMRLVGQPALVIANHFDDFHAPPNGALAGLDPESRAAVEAFPAEVHACAPATRVVIPEHFQPIRVP
jgi:L-ascorbate metabolism protein UlaG (beta-lactamase superfamily)